MARVLELLCARIQAQSGALFVSDGNTWRTVEYFSAPLRKPFSHLDELKIDNPYWALEDRMPAMRCLRRDEIFPLAALEQAGKHAAFLQWLGDLDITDALMARLPLAHGYECRLAFRRIAGAAPFGWRETGFIDSILDPMLRVLEHWNTSDQNAIAADVSSLHLQQLGHGIVTIDDAMQISHCSEIAREIATRNDDSLSVTDGALRLRCPEASVRIEDLVRRCALSAGSRYLRSGGAMSLRREGRLPLCLTVYPFLRAASSADHLIRRRPQVAVTLFDPQRGQPGIQETLRGMYGLTVSESQICSLLTEGQSLRDIAGQLGLTTEGTRSRLKRVFSKTGARRQSDLIRLVLTSPAQTG